LAGRWYGCKEGQRPKLIPQEQEQEQKQKKITTVYENEKYYLTINGSRVSNQGYDAVYNLYLTESGKYAYFYRNDGKWYVNINGSSSPAYDEVGYNLSLTESGKYAYYYRNDDKWYVNINGSSSPTYDAVGYNLSLTESGKYACSYRNNGKWYANINGSSSPAYDGVYHLTIEDNGTYGYYYAIDGDGIVYQNNNGKISKTNLLVSNQSYQFHGEVFRTSWEGTELYSSNKGNSFFSNYEYEYVVIDGRRFGKSPALHAWYEKNKNAFIWNAIEGKELVVYEYKLQ
jgi:hypothetical protein